MADYAIPITNLIILQGATFNPVLTALDQNNTPVDWTGYKARMQARASATDPTVIFSLTTEGSSINQNGTAVDQGTPGIIISGSKVQLYLSAAATALLTFDTAAYDLEIYYTPLSGGADYVYRPFQGAISNNLNVTR